MYQTDKVPLLVKNLHFISNENQSKTTLSGLIFVITGSLNHFSNRSSLKKELESLGAKVSGSVSAKTSYLINNDIDSMSSKNQMAKKLNVPIINEESLLNMMKYGGV